MKRSIVIFFISFFLFVQQPFSQSYSYPDQDCLSCHGKPDIAQITIDGKVRSLFVDPEEWNQDIHHIGRLLCVDCHTFANPYFHFREGYIDVDCARCHPEEEEEYQKNIHLTFAVPSPGKELPLCFHCHTKHYVLRHDDPSSSVHQDNIGETCGSCHAEVMVQGVLTGSSLGKISGHRKGDIAEKFDMNICINCHYEDSAHGVKRVYKDFCSRCHDIRSMANVVMGPTHTALPRYSWLNYAN
ncbi:MAG: cytochrome c3 family protein, partial [Candidatus Aminicenantes bacterium]